MSASYPQKIFDIYSARPTVAPAGDREFCSVENSALLPWNGSLVPRFWFVITLSKKRVSDLQMCRAAYRNRTDDLRITGGVLPACAHATCTDSTDHRTDGAHDAGIIRRAVPRTVPRPRRRGFRKEALIGAIVDRQGSDAGVGRCGAADSPAQMAASPNTYSDALCLALHAISNWGASPPGSAPPRCAAPPPRASAQDRAPASRP